MRPVLDRVEDSPEAIRECLNCTKPPGACDRCSGPQQADKRRGRRGYSPEIRASGAARWKCGSPSGGREENEK